MGCGVGKSFLHIPPTNQGAWAVGIIICFATTATTTSFANIDFICF